MKECGTNAESYRRRKLAFLNAMSSSADKKPWSKNHSYFFGDYDGAFNAGIEGDSALLMELG
jgi:hypothetical protein